MDKVNNSLEKRQSTLIKAMRFPLIVLVVFSHSLGFQHFHIDLSLEGWNIYHFFSEMISHNLCKIAVCWFFVFAGYFFFLNVPEEGFSSKWLIEKWKRRIWTLLIPYIIWNIMPLVAGFIKNNLFFWLGIQEIGYAPSALISDFKPLSRFLLGPANYPLWFMRDLMIMCLLAPILYAIFKNLPRWGGIIVLCVLFILPFETPVLTWRGYFFFSLGAFLGIQKINILSLCRRVKWSAVIMAVVTLLTVTFLNDSPLHNWALRVFYPFGMITMMNIVDKIIDDESRCNRLSKLSAAVFFIYAAHEIYILGWIRGFFFRLCGEGLIGSWIRYIFVPVFVVLVCLGLYYILNRIIPRTLAFVCGGRSKSR